MLKQARADKPLFIQGHSMGCMNTQQFLTRNPSIRPAGVIYGAPYFEMPKSSEVGWVKYMQANLIKSIGEELVINPVLNAPFWVSKCKHYHRKIHTIDGMCLPIISGGISISMMDNIRDVNQFASRHTLPTLIFNAGKDKIVDIKGA